MNKQAIRDLFQSLLEDFEKSESLVIDERSSDIQEDLELLGEKIEKYHDDLEELLKN